MNSCPERVRRELLPLCTLIDWQRQAWEKSLLPDQLHHLTIPWPHQLAEVNVPHVVTEEFIWAFAEPAHNLFLFLSIDVDLAQESEFFLQQQMCLVHSFAVTICAVVEKKNLRA